MTTASDGVHELVRQRDQLRAWIAKLDEVQGTAASRVTERVRADYQDRLRRVTEDLSAHADEIRRGLDDARGQLSAAEERRTHAIDALEETRLRHVIGELDQGAWDQARQPLEAETAAADEAVAHAQAEVERLSTLSSEIDAGAAQAEPEPEEPAPAEKPAWEPEPAYAEEPEAPTAGEQELPFLYASEAETEAAPPTEAEPDPVSGEDLAAWISEVEAEAGTSPDAAPAAPAAPPADEQTAEGWDPFANEFGGSLASPATQPGDAATELPWLGALEGSASTGRWSAPAHADDELAFLDHLESGAPVADDGPAPELAEDDLAFLEELDRAISGGAASGGGQTPPPTALPGNFTGGSGDAAGPTAAEPPAEGAKKSGEALLCKECGAINEPQAWYCEICGSEL